VLARMTASTLIVLGALTTATHSMAKELRFAHAYPTASQHHRNAEWFTQQVTERTNGEVTFRLFPSAQLMPINQELPAILSGQISMTYSIAPVVASVEPLWGVFDLPFLFDVSLDDLSHGKRFFESEQGIGVLAAAMEKRGFKLVTIAPTDYPSSFYMTAPNAPKTIEDLSGKKVRSPGGQLSQVAGQEFGYSPVAIAGAELVPALAQGVVDGGILPPVYAYDNKLPVKGLNIAPFMWAGVTPIIMSLAEFNSLTEQQQQVLMAVGAELRDRSMKQVEESANKAIEGMRADGADVVILSGEEAERWRETAKPVWEAFLANNGEEARMLIDEAVRLRDTH
jgi:TRAP-type C4-dicarboxylate transport system substrate-binding protein